MYIEIPPLSLSLSNIGELKKGQLAIRNSNESCEKKTVIVNYLVYTQWGSNHMHTYVNYG